MRYLSATWKGRFLGARVESAFTVAVRLAVARIFRTARVSKRPDLVICCLAALALTSCGYHVAGKADMLPKTIRTIAIPTFGNVSARYTLTDLMPAAITREFISRTKYQIIADASQADAVLKGAVTNYFSYPIVFDPATGRASTVQLSVFLKITLEERATGKILFSRPTMEVKERYEISVDPKVYFDESGPALQRISRDVARSIVSAVLENF